MSYPKTPPPIFLPNFPAPAAPAFLKAPLAAAPFLKPPLAAPPAAKPFLPNFLPFLNPAAPAALAAPFLAIIPPALPPDAPKADRLPILKAWSVETIASFANFLLCPAANVFLSPAFLKPAFPNLPRAAPFLTAAPFLKPPAPAAPPPANPLIQIIILNYF